MWGPVVAPLIQLSLAPLFAVGTRYALLILERVPPPLWPEFVRTGRISSAHMGVSLSSDISEWAALVKVSNDVALADAMRKYFVEMRGLIKRYRGFNVDIAGDGLFAMWIDNPKKPNASRVHASNCALEMKRNFLQMFPMAAQENYLRIGLSCGNLEVRSIGDQYDFQIKPFGSVPVEASRIENLNKKLGTRVLAIEDFVTEVNECTWRYLGLFQLQGLPQALKIYECVEKTADSTNDQGKMIDSSAESIRAFEAGDTASAKAGFEALLQQYGDDGPAKFYLRIIQNKEALASSKAAHGPIVVDKQ